MGAFEDHLAMLRNPGTSEPPATILDDLYEAYTDDIGAATAAVTERDRLIAERDEALAEARQELTVSKAKNFDLSQQIPAGNGGQANGGYVPPDTKGKTIDDLFERI